MLQKLLVELGKQHTAGEFTYSVVVADNDCEQSARSIVDQVAESSPMPIKYCVEPQQNIALVRNRVVANAHGDFLAFIDDDEVPGQDWLLTALRSCVQNKADGVLAPVRPYFEHKPPPWLIKGRFFERPEHPTGYRLSWRETRTGNVLLRREILEGVAGPFRAEFRNGGEDQEFFKRIMDQGSLFIWCNEAPVHELVPPERCRRSYLLKRALQRGQAEKGLNDLRGVCKSIVAVPLYGLILPFVALAGQHCFMQYLVRLCSHAGKLASVFGWKPVGDTYLSG